MKEQSDKKLAQEMKRVGGWEGRWRVLSKMMEKLVWWRDWWRDWWVMTGPAWEWPANIIVSTDSSLIMTRLYILGIK